MTPKTRNSPITGAARGTLSALLLGLLLLTACTPGDPAQRSSAPGSPTAGSRAPQTTAGASTSTGAPTARPEIAVPERPASMGSNSIQTAIDVAVHVTELYGYSWHTGDLGPWDAIVAEECEFCVVLREEVADLYANGGYATDGEIVGRYAEAALADTPDTYWVDLDVVVRSRMVFTQPNTAGATDPAERIIRVTLDWADGDWLVLDIAEVAPEHSLIDQD
ncbi:hypothetical protein IM660_11505 [Ruania alkalisoli]|uniref:DUF6318 domain-containing protein n=1 Tax=Ruania alkalisoli TaxID=2779775 RepID=A0A7M1SQ79_9MICO|nr:DUF6318 family protein [Ruania alkalisoli]QOR69327.1 hypothetical protein IM660_11505 [Ruania alkalisoli]